MGKMLIFHGGGTEIPQPEILVGNAFCTIQALKCLHFEYSEEVK